LAPGVKAVLRALKPEFVGADGVSAQLYRRRRVLGLSMEEAAAIVGVRRWTCGL
jgi:hypothetical protein